MKIDNTISQFASCRFWSLFVFMLYCSSAGAGSIEFSFVTVRLTDHQYFLNAQASIELNTTIEAGLQSGVPLYFDVDGKVLEVRDFLWDKAIFSFNRRYSLVYYELTRHYRVNAVGENITKNFRSLFDALEYLGSIRNLRIVSKHLLNDSYQYRGEIVFSLDTAALPLQLTPQTLVSSAWRLRSEDYNWQIN